MNKLESLKPYEVFKYFEEMCNIPHGSGNRTAISQYCVNFAKSHNLRFVCDDAKNVIIYKEGSKDLKNTEPIILQAHLDMVCEKISGLDFDFDKEPLDIFIDGDFVKAKNTTLGADNGIGVAMILAILADENLSHPPIEAVFTTDEEIGMLGAGEFDFSLFSAKKMINLDSEEENILTVSCAGGCDVTFSLPFKKEKVSGEKVSLIIDGLKGGHSGVEIDKGRVNANMLCGRILNHLKNRFDFNIAEILGGAKANAIPFTVCAKLITKDAKALIAEAKAYFEEIKTEIFSREPGCTLNCDFIESGTFEAIDSFASNRLIEVLLNAPNGIVNMSAEIKGLVETSLNLGVVRTNQDNIFFHFALRSNKASALDLLVEKMISFGKTLGLEYKMFGRYEPWEFKSDSPLQQLYIKTFNTVFGKEPKIEAIHAGLECAVFSAKIPELDCISIGPDIFDVHSPKEKVSVSSVLRVYELLKTMLNSSLQK